MKNTKKTKTTKPSKLTFADLGTTVVLRTENHDGQTLAWTPHKDGYVVALDGQDRFEEAAKAWFTTWMKGDFIYGYEVNINTVSTMLGRLFIISIRKA